MVTFSCIDKCKCIPPIASIIVCTETWLTGFCNHYEQEWLDDSVHSLEFVCVKNNHFLLPVIFPAIWQQPNQPAKSSKQKMNQLYRLTTRNTSPDISLSTRPWHCYFKAGGFVELLISKEVSGGLPEKKCVSCGVDELESGEIEWFWYTVTVFSCGWWSCLPIELWSVEFCLIK